MNRLCLLAQKTQCFQRMLQLNCTASFSNTAVTQYKNDDSSSQQHKQKQNTDNGITAAKKKAKASPKITLIGQNQSMSITSLEDAHKLAKRRDLHLRRIQELDTKTQRAVYKLVTSAELLEEELKDLNTDGKSGGNKNTQKKTEKTLTIGSRISDHDLASRQKNICKWLGKQHEVRILIQGGPDDMTNMERICKAIEKSIKEPDLIGKIQQKRSKGAHIKFNIVPIVQENSSEEVSEKASPKTQKDSQTSA